MPRPGGRRPGRRRVASLLWLAMLTGPATLTSCSMLFEITCAALLGLETGDEDDDEDRCNGRDFHHSAGARGASAPRQPVPPHPGRPVGR